VFPQGLDDLLRDPAAEPAQGTIMPGEERANKREKKREEEENEKKKSPSNTSCS